MSDNRHQEDTTTIDSCIELENKCAGIYRKLSALFPEARDLFKELAIEEENHAVILKLARAYVEANKLPVEKIVPVSSKDIQASIKIADTMAEEIDTQNITLQKALEMSLMLEKSLGEVYLREAMTEDAGSEIIAKLQRIFFDEDLHSKRIEDFIKTRKMNE